MENVLPPSEDKSDVRLVRIKLRNYTSKIAVECLGENKLITLVNYIVYIESI